MSRLGEVKQIIGMWFSDIHDGDTPIVTLDDIKKIDGIFELVEELENRNKQLEYASMHNGELNEFLQKRKLPPSTLGRHVVDVVMDYVEDLERNNKSLEKSRKEIADSFSKVWKEGNRYKQDLDKILCTDDFEDAIEYAEKVIRSGD